MSKPNILWICSDQQRFDTLGCYGNGYVQTPNIDRLAAGGVLFEHAYCQNPLCTPSRSSFLTGRYPRTTGCVQNGQSIPEREVLVTRLLADAGYVCGLSGKLHLSACNPRVCSGSERRIDDGYAEFHWSHHPGPDWPANAYIRWLQENGESYDIQPCPQSEYVRHGMAEELHQTTWCAERAVQFMRANAKYDHPWLFSVNFFDPHHPFDPPESLLKRYVDRLDEIPLPNYVPGELDNKPEFQRNQQKGGHKFLEMSETDHRMCRAAYWAMIDLIDMRVGRMLDALDETGQRENTLVIFMSDHGEMLGDHGFYLKGPHFYDPAVRVPLIVSMPPAFAPRRCDALVELVDLAPTLLDAAGLDHHPGMQGRSLWPLLAGDAETHREDVYSEHYSVRRDARRPANVTMVRTRQHKLTAVHGEDMGELYDLDADPTETRNLWFDPSHIETKLRMLKRLTDRMAGTVDPLPLPTAPW